jgi:hypothetical protein
MMNPGPPKTNKSPVKPILLIVIGAAIVIWISQRNPSSNRQAPRSSSSSSISNSISSSSPTGVSDDQKEQVEKYPMLASPDEVAPNTEFPVEVSLTDQKYPGVQITSDKSTPEGKLVFDLPAAQDDKWKLNVYLHAPGMIFTDGGTGSGSIVLHRHGNATPAMFLVKSGPGVAANSVVPLLADFWFNGSFLASVARDVRITSTARAELATQPATSKQTVGTAVPNPSNDRAPVPDMTVFIKDNTVYIASPALVDLQIGTLDMNGFPDFIAKRSPANAGRGSELVTETTWRQAETFGEDLYDNYAPDVFKKVFWELDGLPGKKLRTIQIYSDKPDIPWELMRPARDGNGTDRRDFLGLDYSVARWDTHNKAVITKRPAYIQTMTKMFVIAPHYSGNLSLDGEAKEIQKLALLDGYNAVQGNTTAIKTLFQYPPQGIVHFAGHGELDKDRKEFEIVLEDGRLDTSTWRSMTPAGQLAHTFFFFNACDVGGSTQVGNFVDGFGPAVLGRGASGYIGALWPVNDQVAADFSIAFYGLMQDEMRKGSANISQILERTRQTVYGKTKNPTALAYVMYGDTDLNFVK